MLWDDGLNSLGAAVLRRAVFDLASTKPYRVRRARNWLSLPADAYLGPTFWCRVAGIKPATFYRTLADSLEAA